MAVAGQGKKYMKPTSPHLTGGWARKAIVLFQMGIFLLKPQCYKHGIRSGGSICFCVAGTVSAGQRQPTLLATGSSQEPTSDG